MEDLLIQIWSQVMWPLGRIIFFVAIGLIVANLIESLNWTDRLAIMARPLIRIGRLSSITGASFSVAFISGVSANSMLAEALDKGKIGKKEMVFANLFNTLPRFFLHLPTVFFLTLPFIGKAAVLYVGITLGAAILQTSLVVFCSRLMLPPREDEAKIDTLERNKRKTWREVISRSIKRLKKRMRKILLFLVPVYVVFFILSQYGFFHRIEELFAQAWFLSWLPPQSLGIVIMHVTVEFSAGLAAASVLLADNSLGQRDIVLALLVGNILAAPIRAIRHQLPYYVGIFPAQMAVKLVVVSQVTRGCCLILVGVFYYYMSFI